MNTWALQQNGRSGKSNRTREMLMKMQRDGQGESKVMFASPNDPYHYETRLAPIAWDELSGNGRIVYQEIKEKIYDHPVKTVDEWLKAWGR